MVKLTKIYTRTGDAGDTGLGNGTRVPKYDLRVEAFGSVDETNATIGLAGLYIGNDSDLADTLSRIQNDLFDVGADLCTPEEASPKHPPLRVSTAQVDFLERQIDSTNQTLSSLRSFILPGGRELAAHLHLPGR